MNAMVEFYANAPNWQKALGLFAVYFAHFWLMVWLVWLFMKERSEKLEAELMAKDQERLRALVAHMVERELDRREPEPESSEHVESLTYRGGVWL